MRRTAHGSRVHMQGLALKGLQPDSAEEIHLATLDVLGHTGVHIEDLAVLEMFADAGCRIDRDAHVARIPSYVIEDALRTSPKQLVFAGRDPKTDILLDTNRIYCLNHCEAPFQNDLETGEQRMAVKQDIADTARVCDYLSEIDVVIASVTVDDHPLAGEAHRFHAALQNTTKPIHISATNATDVAAMIEMAKLVVGGADKLRERPLFSVGHGAVSPLSLPKESTDAVRLLAEAGIPVNLGSMPLMSATAPATLAGTIVLLNAVQLAAFVFVQLVNRGAPQWYGTFAEAVDLRTGLAETAAPETRLLGYMAIEMARYYGFPSQVLALWTESKTQDLQCGYEKALGGLMAGLGGTTMLHGAGCLDSGLTNDLGQLVADNELYRMLRRMLQGIEVSDAALMVDEIDAVGQLGEYMSRDSTLAHMRDFMTAGLLDRNPRAQWQALGATTLETRSNEEAKRILAEHQVEPLPDAMLEEMDAILAEAEAKAGEAHA